MIKLGMFVGNRYEIVEKIGTGGMSDVYRAKDHKLNRFVAVKVLKQEFIENENFVSKFRTEAQSAAGLMHPNIVNVYDVGEENDIHYIVMELVEGITLKKYIEKKVRLSFRESISIAIQVSMGIQAAHNNHVIHRDIKPQNIIISRDGKVKVTDFGIAKAATSNTITSNVMGSVHYTSPEQARGGYSDEKSDIYSLGITIFEMLTGRVPFIGDTTVAIAIMHIQDPMPSPRIYAEDIPVSAEKIVLKCTMKSPDKRYPSIEKVITDLKRALNSPDEDFVELENYEKDGETKVIRPNKNSSKRAEPSKKSEGQKKNDNTKGIRINDSLAEEKENQAAKKKKPAKKTSGNDTKQKDRQRENSRANDKSEVYVSNRMDHFTTILAIGAAVIIGCVILFFAGNAMGLFSEGNALPSGNEEAVLVEMPDIEGMSLERAKSVLSEAGLDYNIDYNESTEVAENLVISADVNKGEKVAKGTIIKLTVSSGAQGVAVESVIGKSAAEATAILERAGFKVIKEDVDSAEIAKGMVALQSPEADEKVPLGTTVIIKISTGKAEGKVAVPNLIGLTEMDAMAVLTEAGLSLGSVTETNFDDTSIEAGTVCIQEPEADSFADAGAPVAIKISLGPQASTYSFNSVLEGPQIEDNTYMSGTETRVELITSDDRTIYDTIVTSFPLSLNISGIQGSAEGRVRLTYLSSGAATTLDGNGSQSSGTPVTKVIERPVTFTPQ